MNKSVDDNHFNPPKKVAIVANGSIHDFDRIASSIRLCSYVIAADGGLKNCSIMGISPNLVIGDMDSVNEPQLSLYPDVPQKKFPVDKDKTDVELAIEEALSLGAEKIIIFGGLEKRIDHSLYNLHLLSRYPEILSIESEYEISFAIKSNSKINSFPGQVVSLLPLTSSAQGITTQGLKWELSHATFDKHFMSISNICLGNFFNVEIKSGDLLLCLCKS